MLMSAIIRHSGLGMYRIFYWVLFCNCVNSVFFFGAYSKSGFVEEYDTHKLKDKAGNAILCHHCGKSAVDGQRIISCDFCPLSWHLDCIGPMPMSNPPPTQKKWMCPAHADLVCFRFLLALARLEIRPGQHTFSLLSSLLVF